MLRTIKKRPPLHKACEKGHFDVIKRLLDYGADPNIKNRWEETPFHQVLRCSFLKKEEKKILKILKLLLAQSEERKNAINAPDDRGYTPLHIACKHGYLEIVKWLIEKGAEIETQDKDGDTPLHSAIHIKQVEVVKCLVSHDANVNAQAQNGFTPLHRAIVTNCIEIVKHLVSHDAILKTKNGDTALHIAVREDNGEISKYLLANGANLEDRNNKGCTPSKLILNKYTKIRFFFE